jgi:hypothetical protein
MLLKIVRVSCLYVTIPWHKALSSMQRHLDAILCLRWLNSSYRRLQSEHAMFRFSCAYVYSSECVCDTYAWFHKHKHNQIRLTFNMELPRTYPENTLSREHCVYFKNKCHLSFYEWFSFLFAHPVAVTVEFIQDSINFLDAVSIFQPRV